MVCLLRIYKKYLSHFINTVTWAAAHGILHPKISERPHTSPVPRYRFWQSRLSFLGSWWLCRWCHLSNALRHFGGVNLPGAAPRAWQSMLGTLSRGIAAGRPPVSFKQDEISLPALEICLGEDHRIKTKAFQTTEKIISNVVSGICNSCNNVCNE